jgi:hypothetical protein
MTKSTHQPFRRANSLTTSVPLPLHIHTRHGAALPHKPPATPIPGTKPNRQINALAHTTQTIQPRIGPAPPDNNVVPHPNPSYKSPRLPISPNTSSTMLPTPHTNLFGRGRSLRAAITITCQLAFVLFGYDQGVFSGIVGNPSFLSTFSHPSPGLEGIIVAIYNLGCFTGCIFAFIWCEDTGRKWAMWIAMGFVIVSV